MIFLSIKRLFLIITPVFFASTLLVDYAIAQLSVEEIVVTARKREENLQDVPLSITALSAEDISRKGITDLESVARLTAGLSYEDLSSTFNGVLTIRGLAQAEVQSRTQNVAVFVDGLYIPRNYSIDMGITDFERIEVVKGPQSALFGNNAFAGAVNYVSIKPSLSDFEANAELTFGSAGRLDYKFALGGPIVENVFAIRGSYASTEFDGNRKNNFPNITKELEETGGYDREAFNIGVILSPMENLTIDASFKKVERSEEVRPGYTVSGNRPEIRLNCGPVTPNTNGNPSFYCGEIPNSAAPFQSSLSNRPSGDLFAPQPGSDTESDIYRIGLNYDIDDDWSFSYSFGKVDAQGQEITHLTDEPQGFGVSTSQKEGGINDFESHEARVAYNPSEGAVSAEIGYYSAKQQDDFAFQLGLVFGFLGPVVINDPTTSILDMTSFFIPLRNFRVNEDTDAIFGSITYNVADNIRFTAEARNSWVDVTFLDNIAQLGEQSDDYNNFTPRITFEYDYNEDSLLYASIARGVKAGGFNGFLAGPVTLLASEQTFSEEKNWTYEIGSKNTFADGRFVFNAAAYYVDWSSAQVQSLPSNFNTVNLQAGSVAPTIFLNIGDVKNLGFEFDGTYLIDENFSLNFAASISDPKYKNGTKVGQFVGICDDIFCPADGDVSGNSLPRQSKNQFAIGGQYESTVINDNYDIFVRTDLTYQSKRITDALNLAWAPPRYNLSASAGISGDNWSLTAWGDNLTGEKYVTSSLFIIQFSRYGPAINDGTTGGVTLKINL